MAEVKWIKITTNMFDDEKIKLIDAMPERDTIFYVWIRLLTQAGKTNAGGYIFLSENVPYTDEMLSTLFNRQINSIRLALKALNDFGMIEINEKHLIKISNWGKHQNIEGMEKVREQNRIRKQKQRTKTKELGEGEKEDVTPMSRDSHATDIDIDIEEDIDKEKDIYIKAIELCKYYTEIKPAENITQHLSTLEIYVQDYSFEWCKEALKKTIASTNKFVPNYMLTILQDWQANGKPKPKPKEEPNRVQAAAYKPFNFDD